MNTVHLGGWIRLWIILCVVYGGIVATVTFIDMPSRAGTPMNSEFLRSLSDDSLKVLARPNVIEDYAKWIVDNKEKKGTTEFDAVAKKYLEAKQVDSVPVLVRTPDGFEYNLPGDSTKEEGARIGREYEAMQASRLSEFRWSKIRWALGLWVIPCALILCAGLAARWVYRGFKGDKR